MDHLPDRLQIIGRLGVRIIGAVEVEIRLGSIDLGCEQVVEGQSEFLGEIARAGVSLVDEFPTMFGDLPGSEVGAIRSASAAEPGVGLIDGRGDPGLAQPVRAGQASKTGTDDHHTCRAAAGFRCHRGRSCSQKSTACSSHAEEVASADRTGTLLVDNLGGFHAAHGGFSGGGCGLAEESEKRGVGHSESKLVHPKG
jgi:hypothetical protein